MSRHQPRLEHSFLVGIFGGFTPISRNSARNGVHLKDDN